MIFIAFSLGQLAYGQLDIAAELLRETLQLQFFSLFGGIAEVFLKTRFGSIDSRVYASESDPHLFVAALGVIGPIDRQHLIAFLITRPRTGLTPLGVSGSPLIFFQSKLFPDAAACGNSDTTQWSCVFGLT